MIPLAHNELRNELTQLLLDDQYIWYSSIVYTYLSIKPYIHIHCQNTMVMELSMVDKYIKYCQTSYISHTLVGNIIIGHSDVVGAAAVSAAPTTSSFLT